MAHTSNSKISEILVAGRTREDVVGLDFIVWRPDGGASDKGVAAEDKDGEAFRRQNEQRGGFDVEE